MKKFLYLMSVCALPIGCAKWEESFEKATRPNYETLPNGELKRIKSDAEKTNEAFLNSKATKNISSFLDSFSTEKQKRMNALDRELMEKENEEREQDLLRREKERRAKEKLKCKN